MASFNDYLPFIILILAMLLVAILTSLSIPKKRRRYINVSEIGSGEKYPSLRFVCGFFQVIASLIVILSVVFSGLTVYLATTYAPAAYRGASMIGAIVIAVLLLISGITIAIWVFAHVDYYRCIMDIEKNTRQKG